MYRLRAIRSATRTFRHTRRFQSTAPDHTDAAADTEPSNEQPLPFLQRPPGVDTPPTSTPQTWQEKRAELLDYDKHLEKRRHLLKEATKGYFNDLNALKRHGGKAWVAPAALIREDKSLYFPDVSGTALESNVTKHTADMCKGKVSIIGMLSSKMSESHIKTFVESTLDENQENPNLLYVQINLQENLLKSLLVSMFRSSLRQVIPREQHATYLVSSQNMEYLREPLMMLNKHVGYVYLLDGFCRVRWAGCGFARPEESEALRAATCLLLQRHEASLPSTTSN